MSNLSILGRVIIVLLILGSAGATATLLVMNPAKSKKKDEVQTSITSVRTDSISLGNHAVEIEVLGRVIPARETILKAQVDGAVISVADDFVPGGYFEKDTVILTIDPSDYELNVQMQKAAVAQALAAYHIEKGQQATAKEELEILQKSTGKSFKSTDLALRKPQLAQAQADLDSARAQLAQAELDLERTVIKAPYNALLTLRETDLGNIISTQDTLGRLVSTDSYWVEIDVPVSDMRWLEIPGTKAKIKLDNGRGYKDGDLLKMTGTLDGQSRLAQMIVSVPTPLQGAPLVLGDFVKVSLIGKSLKASARVPQSYVRGGNKIWIARDGKLVIQDVVIAHKDRIYAYITDGLQDNDQVVTSSIITPISGMDIKLLEERPVE